MASATAGNNISLTTSNTTLYDPAVSGPCRGIIITNRAASSGNALINALGVQTVADFAGISPGVTLPFMSSNLAALGVVTAKSDSTATIDYTIVR